MMALDLTCGFEYARSCSEDQFFQLSCSRGQCNRHAIIEEEAGGGGGGSRLSTGAERESRKGEWCHAQVCVCVCVCVWMLVVCMNAVPDP